MKDQIKEIRVKVDGLAQLTSSLKPLSRSKELGFPDWQDVDRGMFNSKEIDKAIDSLHMSKSWQGKMLFELGEKSPYSSGYKTKEDIEPTADVSSGQGLFKDDFELLWWSKELNHIEKVDWLRTEIGKVIQEVIHIPHQTLQSLGPKGMQSLSREFAIARTNCYTHLCEARFWLGFELARIKQS